MIADTLEGDADVVATVSRFLVCAVGALFPAWLEEADGIDAPAGAGEAAVRAIARRAAASGDRFGPFLEAAAASALRDGRRATVDGFAPQTVLRECRGLLQQSYGGAQIALVLARDDGSPLSPQQERAAIWVADMAPFTLRIVGAAATALRRTRIVRQIQHAAEPGRGNAAYVTPLSGRPAPLSEAETRLEAALARCPWAAERRWNHLIDPGPLEPTARVDLLFEAPRCIVEIDGPRHASARTYAADRRRDRTLQLMGYAVLRFTNDEVTNDVQRTVAEIERHLARPAPHLREEPDG